MTSFKYLIILKKIPITTISPSDHYRALRKGESSSKIIIPIIVSSLLFLLLLKPELWKSIFMRP